MALVSLQQIQNATYQEAKANPDLMAAIVKLYGVPWIAGQWENGNRSFEADRNYAINDFARSAFKEANQHFERYSNWNNAANPSDYAAAQRERELGLAALQSQVEYFKQYGIDPNSVPQFQQLQAGFGSVPGGGVTSAQRAAADQYEVANSYGRGTSAVGQAAEPANAQTASQINFKEGLSPEQQAGIQKLSLKPQDQWTATDKANWAFATNNSPLPSAGGDRSLPLGGIVSGLAGATGGNGLGEGAFPDVDMTGWSQAMQDSYGAMQEYVKKLESEGKVVNPNIEINPAMTAKFLAQAKTELEPYYGQIFKQAEQDLGKEFTRLSEDYSAQEKQIGEQYGRQLENTQEDYARRGLAFGSERKAAEKTLADQTNQALQGNLQQATRRAEDIGTQGERMLGSANFPKRQLSFQTGAAPITGAPGVYGLSGSTQNRTLFAPQGGVTGDVERERLFGETQRAKELEGNERSFRSEFYQ